MTNLIREGSRETNFFCVQQSDEDWVGLDGSGEKKSISLKARPQS
jgi:hypothetical protein